MAGPMRSGQNMLSPQEVLGRVVRHWKLVSLASVLGLLGSFLYLIFTTPLYTATMTVAPPVDNMSRGVDVSSAVLSSVGLGGLAAANGPESFRRYEELMQSQIVARRLDEKHHFLQILYPDRWDAQTGRWIPKSGFRMWLRSMAYSLIGRPPPPSDPTDADTLNFLNNEVSIGTPTISSPIRTVSLAFKDPQLARQILSWLHQETDAVVRESMLSRTNSMIDYLVAELPRVTNTDEKEALSKLLVDQEQNRMLLTVTRDYASVVMDPPGAPSIPSHPRMGLTLLLGILLGMGLSIILAAAGIGDWLVSLLPTRKARSTVRHVGTISPEA